MVYIHPDTGKEILIGGWPKNTWVATAFQTRNLGSSLEIQPNVDDSGFIDLRFFAELVDHSHNEIYLKRQFKKTKADVTMPVFYTVRTNLGVSLAEGHYLWRLPSHQRMKTGKLTWRGRF